MSGRGHEGLFPREQPGQIFVLAKLLHGGAEGGCRGQRAGLGGCGWPTGGTAGLWAKVMERRGRTGGTGGETSSPGDQRGGDREAGAPFAVSHTPPLIEKNNRNTKKGAKQ